jgi:hypothetical protein
MARLATDIQLSGENEDEPILKWTDPPRLVCDETTLHVKERIPGKSCEATVRLPLTGLFPSKSRPD